MRKGQTVRFDTKPGNGEPVSVNVIVKGGGSTSASVVTAGATLNFVTAGSKAKPVVNQR